MKASPPPVIIPEPRLRLVENRTPYPHFQCDKMGVGRRFFDTVVVKGTFRLAPGRLTMAPQQMPITLADEMWDTKAPQRSSVKYAGEVVLGKPGTDVVVTGTVRSPQGRPRTMWDVTVMVTGRSGKIIDYRAQVTGPRSWQHHSWLGWVLSDPVPTDAVPIRYELAYGGSYVDSRQATDPKSGDEPQWVVHAENPAGTGFFDKAAMRPEVAYPAPRWQPHDRPATTPNRAVPLTGLGPVARPWAARLRYAGTYDDEWRRVTQAAAQRGLPPDYAADFDSRFFQCAHPALVATKYLHGDEHIGLAGVDVDPRPLVIELPAILVEAKLIDGGGVSHHRHLALDTVHIDLDARAVCLCWRLTLSQVWDVRTAVITAMEVL